MDKIIIFDTTLRDGEQSPGAALNITEKLEIAKKLVELNVDVIEAGFPISSKGDFEAVETIAKKFGKKNTIICALARTNKQDIEAAGKAINSAKNKRIHTFISTSDIHMKYQLHKTKEEIIEMAAKAVRYAKKFTDDVEFSAMDATRSEKTFLCQVFEEAINAGATTINIPDTVGYALPDEFYNLISYIIDNTPNINKVVISVHCHNDLGLATANSLTAIKAGARQIECTINGIGERAGNTSLEEVVMAIKTRNDLLNFQTNINTKSIYRVSKLVSELTGMVIQPNKAIVGANAFAHESGIHQDGVLKKRLTYEIMKPADIGIPSSRITLGKLSGRHAFRKKVQELGFILKEKELQICFEQFKLLADKKREITNDDIIAIIEDELFKGKEVYKLQYFHASCGSNTIPTATVKVKIENKIIQEAACGDGPVDAVFKAIDKITKLPTRLKDYKLRAITSGKDALGEVIIVVEYKDNIYIGRGTSTDIIEASAKAYINALNKIMYRKR